MKIASEIFKWRQGENKIKYKSVKFEYSPRVSFIGKLDNDSNDHFCKREILKQNIKNKN